MWQIMITKENMTKICLYGKKITIIGSFKKLINMILFNHKKIILNKLKNIYRHSVKLFIKIFLILPIRLTFCHINIFSVLFSSELLDWSCAILANWIQAWPKGRHNFAWKMLLVQKLEAMFEILIWTESGQFGRIKRDMVFGCPPSMGQHLWCTTRLLMEGERFLIL